MLSNDSWILLIISIVDEITSGIRLISPAINSPTISIPFCKISGKCEAIVEINSASICAACWMICGAAWTSPESKFKIKFTPACKMDGRCDKMVWMKLLVISKACCNILGAFSTSPCKRFCIICDPESKIVGSIPNTVSTHVVIISPT